MEYTFKRAFEGTRECTGSWYCLSTWRATHFSKTVKPWYVNDVEGEWGLVYAEHQDWWRKNWVERARARRARGDDSSAWFRKTSDRPFIAERHIDVGLRYKAPVSDNDYYAGVLAKSAAEDYLRFDMDGGDRNASKVHVNLGNTQHDGIPAHTMYVWRQLMPEERFRAEDSPLERRSGSHWLRRIDPYDRLSRQVQDWLVAIDVAQYKHRYVFEDDFEHVLGSEGNDSIIGNALDNRLEGRGGDDIISGGDGNDILFGGSGSNRIDGGDGDDIIDGGSNSSTLTILSRNHLYGGKGNDTITGGNGSDIIYGGFGDDRIWGGAGPDRLFGEGGDDFLDGGEGADSVWGGTGDDVIVFGVGDTISGGPAGGIGNPDDIDYLLIPERATSGPNEGKRYERAIVNFQTGIVTVVVEGGCRGCRSHRGGQDHRY